MYVIVQLYHRINQFYDTEIPIKLPAGIEGNDFLVLKRYPALVSMF